VKLCCTLIVAGIGVAGCGDSEADETRRFLQIAEGLDVDATPEARRGGIEELRRLSLSNAGLRTTRDTCIQGHEALLAAERLTAGARTDLEALERSENPRPDTTIAKAIADSNTALERAQQLVPACNQAISRLVLQHRPR